MVNKTPLRLVALEEGPLAGADDTENAAPDVIMSEHDAITRKVPESEVFATAGDLPGKLKRWLNLKILLLVGAAGLGVGVAAWVMAARGRLAPTPAATTASHTAPAHPPLSQPVPAGVPVPAAAMAEVRALPETIRLEVAVDPAEAQLGLDGNLLAGHRLNLEVPKDRGIHILSASASGYVPFNQQVSFSNDVVLHISLRRSHTSAPHQVARPRTSRTESKGTNQDRPAPAQPSRQFGPGMNLEGPALRPAAKTIDERNPYKP